MPPMDQRYRPDFSLMLRWQRERKFFFLRFWAIRWSFSELAPGYQHILEPPGQTKRFLPDASIPTLLTAPGLAFDRSGARIGYGKGFYDRYLGKIPAADRPYLVGLCFSCQLFEILDGQKPHDINMDLIVTERR